MSARERAVATELARLRALHARFGTTTRLAHGASAQAIEIAEMNVGTRFDPALGAFYLAHDGSNDTTAFAVHTDDWMPCDWLSLAHGSALCPYENEPWTDTFRIRGKEIGPDPRVQPSLRHCGWFPIGCTNRGSTIIYWDSVPTVNGRRGQIIAYQSDPDAVYWVAESLEEFLAVSNRALEVRGPWMFASSWPPSCDPGLRELG